MAREIAKIDEFKKSLTLMKNEFSMVLPKHIDPDKFVRISQTAIAVNQALLDCNRSGLYAELLKCAQDGLLPDGREATIQKFGSDAAYMPMIYGICKKARNSGEIQVMDANVVYEKDGYESWVDQGGQQFKHTPVRGERGKPVLTYAYALTKDGGLFFEEIDEIQMAEIEKISRAKTGPWKGAFKDEMRRKSAIRRLCKYRLPSSSDLDLVVQRNDDLFDLKKETAEPAPAQTVGTPTRLQEAVTPKPEKKTPALQPTPLKHTEAATVVEGEVVGESEVPI